MSPKWPLFFSVTMDGAWLDTARITEYEVEDEVMIDLVPASYEPQYRPALHVWMKREDLAQVLFP